jgi:hypothetical protein
MPRKRLTVELPVCEVCGHIGKLPIGQFSGKGFCTGAMLNRHKRTAMKPRLFVEASASLKAVA